MTASSNLYLSLDSFPTATGLRESLHKKSVKNLCMSEFKVGKLLHWSNPTLSTMEANVQWQDERLQLVTL